MTVENDPSLLHDPGGKTRIRLPDGVVGTASFSSCGRYRMALTRDWTPEGTPSRAVLFLGQNPSVASQEVSDPTCHRELDYARRWGFTRYLKANMLDWRATSPKDVPHDPAIARSPENLPTILELTEESEIVVLAYGRLHRRFVGIVEETLSALRDSGRPLYCLGRNADGSAKHPLYLRKDAPLIPFDTVAENG